MGGDRQRRHGIHEAGGEATEAAVAERRVRLDPAQHDQIDSELGQRGAHRLDNAQIGHRVEEHAPDQELERQVIDALAIILISFAGSNSSSGRR